MKHPNGYGTVVKLSGNRRNPYAVRKTVGFDEKYHPIYLPIGYTQTKEQGLILLAQYNNDAWDINKDKITFEELYKLWIEKKYSKLGKSNQRALKYASNHCESLFKMKYKKIKSFMMQDIIDNCGKGYATQAAIKSLLGHLDDFAMEMDIISKSYASLITSDPVPDTSGFKFSDEEVEKVWEIQEMEWVDSVLTFLYTGFRISELLNLLTENVNLEERTIKGGTKTKAGKDRIVPIHSKIFNIIKNRVDEGNKYLFSNKKRHCSVDKYYRVWSAIMTELKMQYTPQECRHTFRSKLDSAGANKKCIDLMMGHKSKEVGERVYTHKTIEELRQAIELITN